MVLSGLLRDLKIATVPHGFRSSFRDWAAEETDHPRKVTEAALAHKVRNQVAAAWAAEETDHPRKVTEAALAHKVRNQVAAAYRRADLFEYRLRLMNDWRPTPPMEVSSHEGLYRPSVRLEACRERGRSLQSRRHASESTHNKPVL